MSTTFGFIAERAAEYPVIVRRSQMSKLSYYSNRAVQLPPVVRIPAAARPHLTG